jgi:hypothetical protein
MFKTRANRSDILEVVVRLALLESVAALETTQAAVQTRRSRLIHIVPSTS